MRRWSRSLVLLKFRWFTVGRRTGFGGGRGALWVERKTGVELHSSVEYVVWFLGFQPGFRISGVCRNNYTRHVALNRASRSGRFCRDRRAADRCLSAGTPGGWQLIGHTSLSLFDPAQTNPSYYVRETACALYRRRRGMLKIIRAGMYTTVQDGGRHVFASRVSATAAHWICLRYAF